MNISIFVAIFSAFLIISSNGTAILSQSQAVSYLVHFGHALPPSPGSLQSYDSLRRGIESFQRFAGITITGKMDRETLEKMNEPRCGNPDVSGTEMTKRKKRYALQNARWPRTTLTYRLSQPTTQLSRTITEREMEAAFKWWSDNSGLTFTKSADSRRADIDIRFAGGSHGDGDPFDGAGQTLAHAFFPTNGDAHFDDSETWQLSSRRGGVNLRIVAAHEFGHSLGLGHSDVDGALMAPFYNPRSTGLHSDDIAAIQRLYGRPVEKPDAFPTARPTTTRRTISTTSRSTTTTTTQAPAEGSCNGRFDAITQLNNGSTYAFVARQFWRLSDEGVDDGFPQSIQSVWGISGSIDAALTIRDRTDLFQGNRVHRFVNGRRQAGSPRIITQMYPGIPSNIDAAFLWSGNGRVYFMKGSLYWRYNINYRRPDYGYPRNISVWRGLPERVDAAMQWRRRTYFFSDGLYYRFNDTAISVAELQLRPYPRRADEWWLGCRDNTLRLINDNGGGGGSSRITISTFLIVLLSLFNISLSSFL